MSSNIMILMLSVSTFLGALGLLGLLWGLRSGQFDDQSKFIDAARYDNDEDFKDAVAMDEKQKKQREKEKNYRPVD